MKTADIRRMQTSEMRMIRMMCCKTLLDKDVNSDFSERKGIEDIDKTTQRTSTVVVGAHLKQMNVETLMIIVEENTIVGNMKRGRPNKM